MTPSVSSKEPLDASKNRQGLTAIPSNRCTSNAETGPAQTVEALAAALLGLSAADRARLAAILLGNPATAPADDGKQQ